MRRLKYDGHLGQVADFEVKFGGAPTVWAYNLTIKVGISQSDTSESQQIKIDNLNDIVDDYHYLFS